MGVPLFRLAAIYLAALSVAAEIVPPTATVSNPVTYALNATGSGTRYDVTTVAEFDAVPLGALTPGSVVNIWPLAGGAGYPRKFGLRAMATSTNKVRINGVTNASGNRPKFDLSLAGAKTAPGCNPSGGFSGPTDVFRLDNPSDPDQQYGEGYGAIVIINGATSDAATNKPAWIEIKNIEVTGFKVGSSFVDLNGATRPVNAFTSAIWVQTGADVLVENCVLQDNCMGFYTMSKSDTLAYACERMTLRNNRIYNNGVLGADGIHTVYMQCTNPLAEGNYFGPNRVGSAGSTFKDRSSCLIFRGNYIESSLRALDMVQSEDQTFGIQIQPDYGTDYVYDNVFVNDFNLPGSGGVGSIHYGGDNLGEDESGGLTTPAHPYRSQLYFWNNTVIHRVNSGQSSRSAMFDLSLVSTKADVWNNVFVAVGTSAFSWLEWAGQLNLRGTNLVYGTLTDAIGTAIGGRYAVNKLGTLLTSDPLMVDFDNSDYRIGAGSPAINAATAAPSGIPAGLDAAHPIQYQPLLKLNGLVARTAVGGTFDLGALEYSLGEGPPIIAPSFAANPVVTGLTDVGSVLTVTMGTVIGTNPKTYSVQWEKNGAAVSGATATTFNTASAVGGNGIRAAVTVNNASGIPVTAYSNTITVTTPATLPASIGNVTTAFSADSENEQAVAVPAGAVAGDEFWIGIRLGSDTATVTWPAGFTEVTEATAADTNLGMRVRVAKRTATGSETGSFAMTTSAWVTWHAHCAVTKGTAATQDAASALGSYAYITNKPLTGASITTTGTNRTILWFAGGISGGDTGALAFTPPVGLAQVSKTDVGNGNYFVLAAGTQTAAGAQTYSGTAGFPVVASRACVVSTIALTAG